MKSNLKIFIIEDDGILRTAYCEMAMRLGYECRESVGLRNPVDEILNYQPHVVLLDTKLPGTTGWDICEELRKTDYGKQMGIIGMSSDYWREEWQNAGADTFVHKSDIIPRNAESEKRLDALIRTIAEKYRK